MNDYNRFTEKYCEAYDMYACTNILLNYESLFVDSTIVSRKIFFNASYFAMGMKDKICFGKIATKSYRSHTKEYVESMCLLLQNDKLIDFDITNRINTKVHDFINHDFVKGAINFLFKVKD